MQRERTHRWDDYSELAREVTERSGLEYLQAIVDGDLPHPPVCGLIGFRVAAVAEGRSTIELDPGEHHYNTIGTVHGSVIVAALDSAAGNAVHSTLPAGVLYTTVDLATTYLRPVTADSRTLRCEGEMIHGGRRVAVSEARLVDGRGRLLAHAKATCLILTSE